MIFLSILCHHCAQPVMPRSESAQDIPRTHGPLLQTLVYSEINGDKDKAGKQVRWVEVMQSIDFYRDGA